MKYAFPEKHTFDFINMGTWQARMWAACDWHCGSSSGARDCCTCKAQCSLNVNISKTYTFSPVGYNDLNNSWGIGVLYYYSILYQFYTQENVDPAYFVSADLTDSYVGTWRRCTR